MKKLVLVVFLFFCVSIARSQPPGYVPTDSLMGWWPFNNNAEDESANTNDGVVNAPLPTNDRDGFPIAAYDFNGISDKITMPALDLSGQDEMSISVWVAPETFAGQTYHEIVRQDNGYTGYPDFLLSFQSSGSLLAFGVGTTGSYLELDVPVTPSVFINSWHHIVAIYNGNYRRIFIDASLIATDMQTGNIRYTAPVFMVGAAPGYTATDENFKGDIDDLGIWKRALTEQEIVALYNGGSSTTVAENRADSPIIIYPNPSTGKLHFRFGEDIRIIEIYSLSGIMIRDYHLSRSGERQLDLEDLAAGSYFLRFYNDEDVLISSERLILLR